MNNEKISVEYTPEEQRILVKGMVEFRNELLQQEKPVEDVDNIILKTINGKPVRKKWWDHER